jgi:hypothetical protein
MEVLDRWDILALQLLGSHTRAHNQVVGVRAKGLLLGVQGFTGTVHGDRGEAK